MDALWPHKRRRRSASEYSQHSRRVSVCVYQQRQLYGSRLDGYSWRVLDERTLVWTTERRDR